MTKVLFPVLGSVIGGLLCHIIFWLIGNSIRCKTWADVNEEACLFNEEEGMQAGLKYLEFASSASDLFVFKAQIKY